MAHGASGSNNKAACRDMKYVMYVYIAEPWAIHMPNMLVAWAVLVMVLFLYVYYPLCTVLCAYNICGFMRIRSECFAPFGGVPERLEMEYASRMGRVGVGFVFVCLLSTVHCDLCL